MGAKNERNPLAARGMNQTSRGFPHSQICRPYITQNLLQTWTPEVLKLRRHELINAHPRFVGRAARMWWLQ
jgi:hypothetical protein